MSPYRLGKTKRTAVWTPATRQRFMTWLGSKLGFTDPEDWYRITSVDFTRHGASGLLALFGHSPAAVLRDFMPEHDWKEWLFRRVPNGFWDDPRNGRRYLDWLGERLGYSTPEEWYDLRARDLVVNRASALLTAYGMSPWRVVRSLMPEHDWLPWRFHVKGFWGDAANRRSYVRWLGGVLGFGVPADWYRVRGTDFRENFGAGLLERFHGSPIAAVRDAMPEHDWKEWLLTSAPQGFWREPGNRRTFLEWLARELGIDDPDQWYAVTGQTFLDHGGDGLMERYSGSPSAMLADCLPEHEWLPWRFTKAPTHLWEERDARAAYLEWLVGELGSPHGEGWRRLRFRHLRANYGRMLAERYSSIRELVEDTVPEGHPARRALERGDG